MVGPTYKHAAHTPTQSPLSMLNTTINIPNQRSIVNPVGGKQIILIFN